jgi:hypothetical protein
VHVPALFQAVDLQLQVNVGSLKSASEPLHPAHSVALVHYVQLLLQAELKIQFCFLFSNYFLIPKKNFYLNKNI